MRILFTGATSFTGAWFVKRLAKQGHDIVAAMRGRADSYAGLKAQRLAWLAEQCEFVWDIPFGSPDFLECIFRHGPFDLLCHHAAETADYKSPDFDAMAAATTNTRAAQNVLAALRESGCQRVVLTGSVFEANEGAGSAPLRAFSGYGLSKTLTSQTFSFLAEQEGLAFGKFVIANPFGSYEERRFTDYLMRSWKDGKTARVATPLYVRDNIHVSLLAAAYCRFASELPPAGSQKVNPSFYVETQGAFAQRFAREIGRRLKIDTALDFAEQTEFPEPAVRINTDPVIGSEYDWHEDAAWDELAAYYAKSFDIARR